MSYSLRPYQDKAVECALKRFNANKKPDLMYLGTGAGKSWVIAEIAKKVEGCDVLILTPSKELCEQDYEKLRTVVGNGVGVYSASLQRKETRHITVATIQSAYRHPELWDKVGLIIADEVDIMPANGSLGTLLEGGKKKLIGLTATPYGVSTSHYGYWYTTRLFPLHKIQVDKKWFWQPVCFSVSEKKLIDEGYLCPLKIYSSPINCRVLKLQSSGGEYTRTSVDEWAMSALDRIVSVMEGAEKEGLCKSGIVFLPSVEACFVLEGICQEHGISAKAVTSKTRKDRRATIIDDHKDGKLKWLINQGVCARGFDNPMVDCLVIARPTKSLRLHRQILGRGLRLAEGKTHCNVLDLTENCKTWGSAEDVEMGKNDWQDTILLKGQDISGMEVSRINIKNIKKKGEREQWEF